MDAMCTAQIFPSGPRHSFTQLLGALATGDSQMSLQKLSWAETYYSALGCACPPGSMVIQQ